MPNHFPKAPPSISTADPLTFTELGPVQNLGPQMAVGGINLFSQGPLPQPTGG